MRYTARKQFYLSLILLVLTFIVYYGLKDNNLTDIYDDGQYINYNEKVLEGLNKENIKWAFTTFYASNYHPITWLSLMVDTEGFGLNPGVFHLHNILLHMLSTILVFMILSQSTKRLIPSFLVAAMFSIHPTHVESVAWAAERKDVLSTFFCLISILLWYRYLWKGKRACIYYTGSILFFLLSMLSKQTYVTLPFLLLLLELWPFNREYTILTISDKSKVFKKRLRPVIDKTPFLLISVIFSVIIYIAQDTGSDTSAISKNFPTAYILYNTSLSYFRYIGSTIYPFNLSFLYPMKTAYNIWSIILCYTSIVTAVVIAFSYRKKYPYIFTGLLWFLGTLVPVIGFVNIGFHSHADRYTYFPTIGLYIIFFWALCNWLDKTHKTIVKASLLTLTSVVFMVFTANTIEYIKTWRNNYTLFNNALHHNYRNPVAHNNLGIYHLRENQYDQAVTHFKKAKFLSKNNFKPYNNIATIYYKKGMLKKALKNLKKSLDIKSDIPITNHLISLVYVATDSIDKAIKHHNIMFESDMQHKDSYINNFVSKLINNGYIKEAATVLDNFNDSENIYLKLNEIVIELQNDSIEKAMQITQEELNKFDNSRILLFNISNLFLKSKKDSAALMLLNKHWEDSLETKTDTLIQKRIEKLESDSLYTSITNDTAMINSTFTNKY